MIFAYILFTNTSSLQTWIATLHPENATVTIDPRFYTEGNAWKTVYNETKYGMYNAAHEDEAVDAIVVHPEEQTRTYAGFLDFVVGFILLINAAAMTIGLEVCALAMRLLSRLFEAFYDLCYNFTVTKYTIGALFWLTWKCFWFSEHVFLYTSVFVTELLAGISWMLCSFFALDCQIGRAAHQRTRRISHLIRWACRRHFTSNYGGSTITVPQGVHEAKPEDAVMPAAAALAGEASLGPIQTATVVSIHDDVESNK